MITLKGVAFLTSGQTDITTVVVKIDNGFNIKYYYLGIHDYTTEENDIVRTIKHGNSLHPEAGEAIIRHIGTTTVYKYKEKIDTNINLRNIKYEPSIEQIQIHD